MKIKTLAAILIAACSLSAIAADNVNINVTGNIIASPCIVNGGSTGLTVDLGNIQATALSSPGSSSAPIDFTLSITNCPAGTSSVTTIFTGTPDTVAGSSYYKNSGTATNLAVQLTQVSTGNAVGNGATITQTVQADRTASIAMKAKAYSSAGGAMPGSINAVIVTTMQYN